MKNNMKIKQYRESKFKTCLWPIECKVWAQMLKIIFFGTRPACAKGYLGD